MKVLLTGADGFIGSHVQNALLERGYTVTKPSGDLRKPLPLVEIDYIIDLASRAEVAEAMDAPSDFIRDNIDITLSIMEFARKARPKHVIHVSSAEVYGPGTHGTQAPHRPNNPYGASKGAQDTICRAYRAAYDVPVSICVTQNVWGNGQPKTKFYPQIKKRIQNDEEVSVMPGIRRFTEVRYLADKLVGLLEKPVGDYHISGDLMTNLEFAQMIAQAEEKELKYKEITQDRPGHEYEYVLKES